MVVASFGNQIRGLRTITEQMHPVADLGVGMHPPHQPKSNDFGRKIRLYFE